MEKIIADGEKETADLSSSFLSVTPILSVTPSPLISPLNSSITRTIPAFMTPVTRVPAKMGRRKRSREPADLEEVELSQAGRKKSLEKLTLADDIVGELNRSLESQKTASKLYELRLQSFLNESF